MKNIPQKIYLQVSMDGSQLPKGTDFNELGEVTWSKERAFPTDIAYILEKKPSARVASDEMKKCVNFLKELYTGAEKCKSLLSEVDASYSNTGKIWEVSEFLGQIANCVKSLIETYDADPGAETENQQYN